MHSSHLFTLTLSALTLAGSTGAEPGLPVPAASLPVPGR